MITAWDVYWVMQLDSIRGTLEWVGFLGVASAFILTVWNGLSRFDTSQFPSLCDPATRAEAWAQRGKVRNRVLMASLPMFLLAAFIPSSKTAAAMIVLPALTSEAVTEPLAKEAAELYGLAKKALAEVAEGEPAKEAD